LDACHSGSFTKQVNGKDIRNGDAFALSVEGPPIRNARAFDLNMQMIQRLNTGAEATARLLNIA
jgi:hypothetical protein